MRILVVVYILLFKLRKLRPLHAATWHYCRYIYALLPNKLVDSTVGAWFSAMHKINLYTECKGMVQCNAQNQAN